MSVYKLDGTIIAPESLEAFSDNSLIQYCLDRETETTYSLIRIFQTKKDGTKQFPFVYAPSGSGYSTQSVLTMNKNKGFLFAMNAGVGEGGSSGYKAMGVLIQNRVLIQQGSHPHMFQLTIDQNGNLNYSNPNTDGNTLINNGVVSALCGFCPLIINYEEVDEAFYNWISHYNQYAQRQIIGQFTNGDYAIISCEGRSFDNAKGWTIPEAISVCKKIGLKFAFNLDGGGSVETIIGKRQMNLIYENQEGRPVPNYIVFNGTSTFFIPND